MQTRNKILTAFSGLGLIVVIALAVGLGEGGGLRGYLAGDMQIGYTKLFTYEANGKTCDVKGHSKYLGIFKTTTNGVEYSQKDFTDKVGSDTEMKLKLDCKSIVNEQLIDSYLEKPVEEFVMPGQPGQPGAPVKSINESLTNPTEMTTVEATPVTMVESMTKSNLTESIGATSVDKTLTKEATLTPSNLVESSMVNLNDNALLPAASTVINKVEMTKTAAPVKMIDATSNFSNDFVDTAIDTTVEKQLEAFVRSANAAQPTDNILPETTIGSVNESTLTPMVVETFEKASLTSIEKSKVTAIVTKLMPAHDASTGIYTLDAGNLETMKLAVNGKQYDAYFDYDEITIPLIPTDPVVTSPPVQTGNCTVTAAPLEPATLDENKTMARIKFNWTDDCNNPMGILMYNSSEGVFMLSEPLDAKVNNQLLFDGEITVSSLTPNQLALVLEPKTDAKNSSQVFTDKAGKFTMYLIYQEFYNDLESHAKINQLATTLTYNDFLQDKIAKTNEGIGEIDKLTKYAVQYTPWGGVVSPPAPQSEAVAVSFKPDTLTPFDSNPVTTTEFQILDSQGQSLSMETVSTDDLKKLFGDYIDQGEEFDVGVILVDKSTKEEMFDLLNFSTSSGDFLDNQLSWKAVNGYTTMKFEGTNLNSEIPIIDSGNYSLYFIKYEAEHTFDNPTLIGLKNLIIDTLYINGNQAVLSPPCQTIDKIGFDNASVTYDDNKSSVSTAETTLSMSNAGIVVPISDINTICNADDFNLRGDSNQSLEVILEDPQISKYRPEYLYLDDIKDNGDKVQLFNGFITVLNENGKLLFSNNFKVTEYATDQKLVWGDNYKIILTASTHSKMSKALSLVYYPPFAEYKINTLAKKTSTGSNSGGNTTVINNYYGNDNDPTYVCVIEGKEWKSVKSPDLCKSLENINSGDEDIIKVDIELDRPENRVQVATVVSRMLRERLSEYKIRRLNTNWFEKFQDSSYLKSLSNSEFLDSKSVYAYRTLEGRIDRTDYSKVTLAPLDKVTNLELLTIFRKAMVNILNMDVEVNRNNLSSYVANQYALYPKDFQWVVEAESFGVEFGLIEKGELSPADLTKYVTRGDLIDKLDKFKLTLDKNPQWFK